MKIVFMTNYLNHHTLPLCEAFLQIPGVSFHFISLSRMPEFRAKLGYQDVQEQYDFVVRGYEQKERERAKQLCRDCDVMIFGAAPPSVIKERLKSGKLIFKYAERVYKKPCPWYELPLRAVKYFWDYGRFKNIYLLCASAYTAGDYARTGTFINKAFKWGYFTETLAYDADVLLDRKRPHSLLWVGRWIDWKHPDIAIEIAYRLKRDGFDFTLDMIGGGEMEPVLQSLIALYGLQDEVHLLGSMSPQEVRAHMEESEVFLFTSDRQEGWGAVLNESMNSGCAVVANHAIGAAPYLIQDGVNGLMYEDGNIDNLYDKVRFLLEDADARRNMGRNAYETMRDDWNAQMAASRLVEIFAALLDGRKDAFLFEKGVCSKAEWLFD